LHANKHSLQSENRKKRYRQIAVVATGQLSEIEVGEGAKQNFWNRTKVKIGRKKLL